MPLRLPRNIRMLDKKTGLVDQSLGGPGGDSASAARRELQPLLVMMDEHMRRAIEESQCELLVESCCGPVYYAME